MQFFSTVAVMAAAAATLVSANTVTFVNQDATTRTIYFTPNAGLAPINAVTIPGGGRTKVDFPNAWIGNWYSISQGKANIPGMLGEVAFQGWNGLTYFDVSAIVNANDHDGVKQMFPASQETAQTKTKFSGCVVFPCNFAYYLPDDIQTVTTPETDLICTLGNSAKTQKREDDEVRVGRNHVLGKL